MSYAKQPYVRSSAEKLFIVVYLPVIVLLYTFLKWPDHLTAWGIIDSPASLYFFGKNPSFWYATLYTLVVCLIAGRIVLTPDRSPYNRAPKAKLVPYQRGKFAAIFFAQLVFFYLLPYVVPAMIRAEPFFADPVTPVRKMAHVYLSPGFVSPFWAVWIFVLIPVTVYFFGKRYCAWFCSCGNLAETIGTTRWGSAWVTHKTPTGATATRMQGMQTLFMAAGLLYGGVLFLDGMAILTAPGLVAAGTAYQDFVIDFIFGALIGVGAYPWFGTRIWCRYGCPLAKFMELAGRYGKSRYAVQANGRCKGLGLCSQQCPMGIDVASFAHKDKQPIEGRFGLWNTACIGCGGCVDRCPVDALEFVSPKGLTYGRA